MSALLTGLVWMAAALDVYEPRVKSKVDLFLSRLALGESSPIDVTELCTFFGFDVMAEIGQSALGSL